MSATMCQLLSQLMLIMGVKNSHEINQFTLFEIHYLYTKYTMISILTYILKIMNIVRKAKIYSRYSGGGFLRIGWDID